LRAPSRDSRARLLVQSFSMRAAPAELRQRRPASSFSSGCGRRPASERPRPLPAPPPSPLTPLPLRDSRSPRRPARATRRSPPSSAPQPYYKTAPLPPSSKAQSRPILSLPDARRDEGVEAVSPLRRQLAAASGQARAAAHAGAAADGGARRERQLAAESAGMEELRGENEEHEVTDFTDPKLLAILQELDPAPVDNSSNR
ncbi:hypothetical protein BRADI_5g25145v3, partial [Brachypodium distachyon]